MNKGQNPYERLDKAVTTAASVWERWQLDRDLTMVIPAMNELVDAVKAVHAGIN